VKERALRSRCVATLVVGVVSGLLLAAAAQAVAAADSSADNAGADGVAAPGG
jgi:hypothetical protein